MAVAAFTLNGTRYRLSSNVVEARLAGVAPESIREHAVQVNGVWYAVKQAFEVAVGAFTFAARRQLRRVLEAGGITGVHPQLSRRTMATVVNE